VARTRELSPQKQQLLGPTIQSLILIPVLVQGQWWGFLGFDQCDREREWSDGEKDSFRAAADMIGAAIERQRTRDALLEAKETLEERVVARTWELREQVKAKEKALAQLAETQQLLMDVSRKSGMAEVATGVLHNVGNVLNSVNVSANLVAEQLRHARFNSISRLADLLREHQHDLPRFLVNDPRGQRVPSYLQSLGLHLEQQQTQLVEELRQLVQNVEHIKQIVSMQQNYARVAGIIETLPMASVVEDALRITESGMVRAGISVLREFEPVPPASVDKHRTLQILVNLLRNARQALEADPKPEKQARVRIRRHGTHRVQVQVVDNGVGIRRENLTRIFSHGFTTKKDGHGFGLHLSALAATEMGGSLTVESAGPGLGACFTLELPLPAESPAAVNPAKTAGCARTPAA
jgi:signal transduction histidine kinase